MGIINGNTNGKLKYYVSVTSKVGTVVWLYKRLSLFFGNIY